MKYIDQFNKSYNLAKKLHDGTYRPFGKDEGKDYIVHPERVSYSVLARAKEYYKLDKLAYEIASVAMVHDVPEDVEGWSVERVSKSLEFNGFQEIALDLVTKREGELYHDFIFRIVNALKESESKLWIYNDNKYRMGAFAGAMVKLEDLIDNSSDAKGNMLVKYQLSKYIIESEFKL